MPHESAPGRDETGQASRECPSRRRVCASRPTEALRGGTRQDEPRVSVLRAGVDVLHVRRKRSGAGRDSTSLVRTCSCLRGNDQASRERAPRREKTARSGTRQRRAIAHQLGPIAHQLGRSLTSSSRSLTRSHRSLTSSHRSLTSSADRSTARADRSPARTDRSPARTDRSPARADRSPARVDRSPARVVRSPARVVRDAARAGRVLLGPFAGPVVSFAHQLGSFGQLLVPSRTCSGRSPGGSGRSLSCSCRSRTWSERPDTCSCGSRMRMGRSRTCGRRSRTCSRRARTSSGRPRARTGRSHTSALWSCTHWGCARTGSFPSRTSSGLGGEVSVREGMPRDRARSRLVRASSRRVSRTSPSRVSGEVSSARLAITARQARSTGSSVVGVV
jgi:hypothetical protein